MSIDPALAVMAALHEKQTTPDSEDWLLLVDGDTVHVTAFREFADGDKRRTEARYGPAPLAEFKKLVRKLPSNHDLGCVTLVMGTDCEERGGLDLCIWLRKQARSKNFSFSTMHGHATAAESVRAMTRNIQRSDADECQMP